MKKKLNYFCLCGLIIFIFISLILKPQNGSSAMKDALLLCGTNIIPSLFPFIVLSNLISSLGIATKLGYFLSPVMRRVFHISGASSLAFILGLLGGYPLGAATASKLYETKEISKEEAKKLILICNNSGLAFIVSFGGMVVFNNIKIGFFLYFIHVLSAIILAILLRPLEMPQITPRKIQENSIKPSFAIAFTNSVKDAVMSVLSICGFVAFFSVIISILKDQGVIDILSKNLSQLFSINYSLCESFISGIFELGGGISSMIGVEISALSLGIFSFLMGFGGLSIMAQSAFVVSQSGMSLGKEPLSKIFHGFIAFCLTYMLYNLMF